MARPIRTVIIHGWSDCSRSFTKIKEYLAEQGIGQVDAIFFADYESREDDITFDDVADGLNDKFIELGFIAPDGTPKVDLNVVVHSTGGLVIRHWIARHYLGLKPRADECPVRRIVMLAPANFGSPLAHRGKSFLGQVVKGRWGWGDFLEVGRAILEGLELGSPYQWSLAHWDLLVDGRSPYSGAGIQVTVLVGIEDYEGARGWVNKPGTDGTVVIAGTSLDSLKLTLDCTAPVSADAPPYTWSTRKAVAEFAFGVLPALDHGSIVDAAADERVGPIVLRALRAREAADFKALATELEVSTRQTYAATRVPVFQQFLVHAVDDSGNSIRDFTLEFFVGRGARADGAVVTDERRLSRAEKDLSQRATRALTAQGHEHSVDPSYRRFLVDVAEVRAILRDAKAELGAGAALSMRVYVPDIDDGIRYRTENLQNIVLQRTETEPGTPTLIFENTTTLLELKIDRCCDLVTVGLESRKH